MNESQIICKRDCNDERQGLERKTTNSTIANASSKTSHNARHSSIYAWSPRQPRKSSLGAFGTNWDHVFRSVRYAVLWGLVHRDELGVEVIGVDEVAWRKGHKSLTLAPVWRKEGRFGAKPADR